MNNGGRQARVSYTPRIWYNENVGYIILADPAWASSTSMAINPTTIISEPICENRITIKNTPLNSQALCPGQGYANLSLNVIGKELPTIIATDIVEEARGLTFVEGISPNGSQVFSHSASTTNGENLEISAAPQSPESVVPQGKTNVILWADTGPTHIPMFAEILIESSCGKTPLTVSFTDLSKKASSSGSFGINRNGNVDSTDRHPAILHQNQGFNREAYCREYHR